MASNCQVYRKGNWQALGALPLYQTSKARFATAEHIYAFVRNLKFKNDVAAALGLCLRNCLRRSISTSSLLGNWRRAKWCFSGSKNKVSGWSRSSQPKHCVLHALCWVAFSWCRITPRDRSSVCAAGKVADFTETRKWKWPFVNGWECSSPFRIYRDRIFEDVPRWEICQRYQGLC